MGSLHVGVSWDALPVVSCLKGAWGLRPEACQETTRGMPNKISDRELDNSIIHESGSRLIGFVAVFALGGIP